MQQFGELLALILCLVTALYVLVHRRTITSVPRLRPFLLPFVLMVVAFLATVAEALPAGGLGPIVFWENSPAAVQRGGWPSELLNLLEHLAYAGSALALAMAVWRRRRPGFTDGAT